MRTFTLCIILLSSLAFAEGKKEPQKTIPAKQTKTQATKKETSVDSIIVDIQKKYKTAEDFNASFQQSFEQKVFKRTLESSGTLQLKKPGSMRWDYKAPSEKSFIIHKGKLWLYQPADKQAYVNHCFKEDTLTSAIAFLWGGGALQKDFTITRYNGPLGDSKLTRLQLKPKAKSSIFDTLILGVDATSKEVKESTVIDLQGNTNRFSFRDVRFNQKLKDDPFVFKTPAGVNLQKMPGSCDEPKVEKAS